MYENNKIGTNDIYQGYFEEINKLISDLNDKTSSFRQPIECVEETTSKNPRTEMESRLIGVVRGLKDLRQAIA